MAKLTLEPDSHPGGPGSPGPGPGPEISHLGRASPSSGQTPLDQILELMGLSRAVSGGKLKPPRNQIKAQGITFTQTLLRGHLNSGTSVSLSVIETIRAIMSLSSLVSVVRKESGKKMGPACRWEELSQAALASSQQWALSGTEQQSSSGQEL